MKVSVEQLKDTTRKAILASGYDEAEAGAILEVLMYAQLRGNNQGVVKLIGAGMPKNPDAKPITVVRDTKLSALLDGGMNQAMIVVNKAVQMAIEKAHEHSFSIVATNNTKTSSGAIGYYADRIAREGFIGFVFAGSGEFVAMYGSHEAVLGTNPLAVGIPNDGSPLVFDMATSAIALFGIIEAKTAGRSIPEGVAYDSEGNLTTDPAAALGGAIRAFGGYKGAALSLIVEVLTHTLGSSTPDADGRKTDWANMVMVLDPELLIDRDEFKKNVATLIQKVKNTKKLPGVDEILVPGERGNKILQGIMDVGEIEIEDNLWAELQKVAEGK